jgi:hypothetical protein
MLLCFQEYVTGFEKRGHLEQNKKKLRFWHHFEADNERSIIEFESSHYLNWLWSYCWLKMYMPIHFVWTMKTLQACISIQYYAWSAPLCHILSHNNEPQRNYTGPSSIETCIMECAHMLVLWTWKSMPSVCVNGLDQNYFVFRSQVIHNPFQLMRRLNLFVPVLIELSNRMSRTIIPVVLL